jgi:TPP-dependent pyruvate/acetoin dehydrogenase alpha subunit
MSIDAGTERAVDTDLMERLYRQMVTIRIFEEVCHRLFMQNEIEGSIHLYQGQEAIAVGVCSVLSDSDRVAATYRGHGVALALGTSPTALFAELLGRASGVCGGRSGSMNVVDLEHRLIGCFAIVGGSIAAGTGAALAAQLRGDSGVGVAFFGDGAANHGYFHECLNLAGVRQLPVVYVCENNQYGEFTPMAEATAGADIAGRAGAYGFPGVEVDGNDVLAVREAAAEAVQRARSGGGPTLVECQTYRHKGHSRHDDPRRYRPAGELEMWLERDPLLRAAASLDEERTARLREQAEQAIDEALAAARAADLPDSGRLGSAEKEASWAS